MSEKNRQESQDELFFDQLKDQFAFFYAVTVTAMAAFKKLREDHKSRVRDEAE